VNVDQDFQKISPSIFAKSREVLNREEEGSTSLVMSQKSSIRCQSAGADLIKIKWRW
jgi:hypothetical protein